MIKPLGERVLVEPIQQEETTSFGIVLPDASKEKPQEGKVVAVGSGILKDGVRTLLEVCRNRSEIRRQRVPDYERKRHSRRSGLSVVLTHNRL